MVSTKNIAILGSTGSIGKSALKVIRDLPQLSVFGLSGHSNTELLAEQARLTDPTRIVISDATSAGFPDSQFSARTAVGPEALVDLATDERVDIVLAAIVGSAGLPSTLAAVQCGKTVALANKETLVLAGKQVMETARQTGTAILPVDSEHSAVYQAIRAGAPSEVARVVLTASGGPFRDFDRQQLACVTVEQALDHPTWQMGRKISIDSATMMNKALEIIEARWLFDLPPDQIRVMIHPQSIIHSLVEFVDGSVVAQLSPPDMQLPIQYALMYPDRVPGPSPKLDFSQTIDLSLEPPDFDRFPALELGYEVAAAGGTAGAVLNAANEAAVNAFLERKISFNDIVVACREILQQHEFDSSPSLDRLIEADRWARKEISKWITC